MINGPSSSSGSWNVAIFTPEWVAQRIFRSDNLELELGVGTAQGILRFRSDGSTLAVRPDRLILSSTGEPWTRLTRVEEQVLATLAELPHTPITSIGVNFGYVIETPREQCLELFALPDTSALSDFGGRIDRTVLVRRLRIGEVLLNLRHVLDDGKVTIHCNFHHEAGSAPDAATKLRGKSTVYHELAVRMIEQVYGEEEEREEQNAQE